MRIKQVGNKADIVLAVVRSGETGGKMIRAGMPVVMANFGVLGLDVVTASTASLTTVTDGALAGIATADLAPGQYGEVVVYGFCKNLALVGPTRANSTSPWPSWAGGNMMNCPLIPDTAFDGFYLGANATTRGMVYPVFGLGAVPSQPTLPSNPLITDLQTFVPCQGFVRIL